SRPWQPPWSCACTPACWYCPIRRRVNGCASRARRPSESVDGLARAHHQRANLAQLGLQRHRHAVGHGEEGQERLEVGITLTGVMDALPERLVDQLQLLEHPYQAAQFPVGTAPLAAVEVLAHQVLGHGAQDELLIAGERQML